MTRITVYRVTITRAPTVDETGAHLSFQDWEGDDSHYQGYAEPVDADLADGWRLVPGDDDLGPFVTNGHEHYEVLREALAAGVVRIAEEV